MKREDRAEIESLLKSLMAILQKEGQVEARRAAVHAERADVVAHLRAQARTARSKDCLWEAEIYENLAVSFSQGRHSGKARREQRIEDILKMEAAGLSLTEIARSVGLSRTQVTNLLEKLGAEP